MNPNTITETLLQLQAIVLRDGNTSNADRKTVEQLRAAVPLPILAHFERLIARGTHGVAIVRNGICCECHMRLPTSMTFSLRTGQDVALCENCGRYLALAPEEAKAVHAPAVAESTRKPRHRATRVAAAKSTPSGISATT